jgi:peptidoglycan hydrolase CwlO-like protein
MPEPVSAQEMFELFQKMVNPMAYPMQSLLTSALNVEELEKKIAELKTVEHWLQTNVALLQMTIKTLEYQKTILEQTNTGVRGETSLADMAMWPWKAMQDAAAAAAAKSSAPEASAAQRKPRPRRASKPREET